MKILFIGLGSIGSRHLKNLTKLLVAQNKLFEIHALRSTERVLSSDVDFMVQKQITDFEEVDDFYDIVFITNPTGFHYDTLKMVLHKAKKIFLEKPVFSNIDVDLENVALPNGTVCYVAAPLRYTCVFQYLQKIVKEKKIYSARVICSSYLPEWRANRDYRQCYSADKQNGGDVGLELIHEWDYLVELFGMPQRVNMLSGKYSNLEITSDDIALYIAEYKDMLVSLSLDYFGRYARRDIELYCEDEVIIGDFIRNEIRFLSSGKVISLQEERDSYQLKELKYFLAIQSEKDNSNKIIHAFEVLKLAKGIIA